MPSTPRLRAWISAGVEVTVCAMDAEARDLSTADLEAAGITVGSQHDHARLLRDSDRFLALT